MLFETFHELLSCYAEKTPEAPALIYDGGGKPAELSWADLLKKAEEAGDRFKGSRTAAFLIGETEADTVVSLFGAVMAGIRVVLLDENLPEDVLIEQIRLTDTDTLYGDEELKEALTPYLCSPKDPAPGELLFFTSGTTERAKAVVLTERSLLRSAYNGGSLLPLMPSDRLLLMLPLNHVFGFVCGLLWALNFGASAAIGRGARHYADDCAFFRPTALSLVPLLLGFCLKYRVFNPELRLLLIGAGDCPPEMLAAAKALGLRVSFGYGLTETSSGIALSLGDDPYAFTICPDFRVSIAEDGEILVESPETVMKGYFRRPEETEKVLESGVLHTGDLGTIDENGALHVTGRKKEMIVLPDGTKIFLPEYEAALSAALHGADLALLLHRGILTLAVSEKAGSEEEILSAIRPVTAAYPRGQQVRKIVRLKEALPRTATGKLKRYAIDLEKENIK